MSRITIGPFIVSSDLRESLTRRSMETGAPHGEIVRRALLQYLEPQRGPAGPEPAKHPKRHKLSRSKP